MELSLPNFLTDESLDHLPRRKRRELQSVVKILLETFETAKKSSLNSEGIEGKILKIILYGSHARGDWVRDTKTEYFSDFDLLVIVSNEAFTDEDYWEDAHERIYREPYLSSWDSTPVSVIVHSLQDVNDKLARGWPFFIDIRNEGILLYESLRSPPLAEPQPLTPEDRRAYAREYYEYGMQRAEKFLQMSDYAFSMPDPRLAAFHLHQAVETLYHCLLMTVTFYSPKLHDLHKLRRRVAAFDPRLQDVWPKNSKLARTAFAQLWKAYVEARYSLKYEITEEQLRWLRERTLILFDLVRDIAGSKT